MNFVVYNLYLNKVGIKNNHFLAHHSVSPDLTYLCSLLECHKTQIKVLVAVLSSELGVLIQTYSLQNSVPYKEIGLDPYALLAVS